jgi:hypothetical protein
VEEVPGCAPCAGIVPCIGIDCPKLGFPPVGKVADEKELLPNHRTKKMMSNLPAYYVKVVLDSLLQVNYGVQVSQRFADASHQVKGTKEVYDLPHKGKC